MIQIPRCVVQIFNSAWYYESTMWIFTTDGFFSAVQDKTDTTVIWIRSRIREDLERLVKRYSVNATEIYEFAGTDYAYRVAVWRDEFSRVMMAAADDVDYTNFKSAVGERIGYDREIALIDVWARMYDMQLEDQDSKRRAVIAQHTECPRNIRGKSNR